MTLATCWAHLVMRLLLGWRTSDRYAETVGHEADLHGLSDLGRGNVPAGDGGVLGDVVGSEPASRAQASVCVTMFGPRGASGLRPRARARTSTRPWAACRSRGYSTFSSHHLSRPEARSAHGVASVANSALPRSKPQGSGETNSLEPDLTAPQLVANVTYQHAPSQLAVLPTSTRVRRRLGHTSSLARRIRDQVRIRERRVARSSPMSGRPLFLLILADRIKVTSSQPP